MRLLNKGFFSIRIQKKVPSVSEANIIFICNRLLSKDFFAKFQLFSMEKKLTNLEKSRSCQVAGRLWSYQWFWKYLVNGKSLSNQSFCVKTKLGHHNGKVKIEQKIYILPQNLEKKYFVFLASSEHKVFFPLFCGMKYTIVSPRIVWTISRLALFNSMKGMHECRFRMMQELFGQIIVQSIQGLTIFLCTNPEKVPSESEANRHFYG